MRKYCIGLSLFLVCNVVASLLPGYEPKPLSEEEIALRKENFKDHEKLKAFLLDDFRMNGLSHDAYYQILGFKRQYEIKDEIARTVLLDIYREYTPKMDRNGFLRRPKKNAASYSMTFHYALMYLGAFADVPTKKHLIDIATDKTKDEAYSAPAIWTYLHFANAQETRDFLVRLLIGKNQVSANRKQYVLDNIRPLYITYTEEDWAKREAILDSFHVAVALEKDKEFFRSLDNFLEMRNKVYATSRQRIEIWKKFDKNRSKQIEQSLQRDNKPLTTIRVSLKELMACDYSKTSIISRFLAGDMRTMRDSTDTYRIAMWAYGNAEDAQTREAIIATVSTALMKEDNRRIFDLDQHLLLYQGYADSPLRKAVLQRMDESTEAETPDPVEPNDEPPPPEPVEKKAASWKLPLLIGILILGGGGGAWCCFRKRRES